VTARGENGTRRSVAGALMLAAVAAIPRPSLADDDDDGGASVSEEGCPLGKGRKAGKIVTTTEKEACGSGGCTQTQTTELLDGDGKTLIVWSDDVGGDFGQPSSLSFACKGGAVIISDGKGDLLTLSYEPGEHQLRLPPPVRKQVEDGWRRPPARGAAASARDRLADALTALTPNPSASDTPPFEVLGLDLELSASQVLLVARDKLEAGAWETAEKMVDGAVPDKPPPTEVLLRRRALVTDRLAALRRQSAPVVVADRRRIGTVLAPPATPVDTDGAPTLFWRGDSLCVGQEDHKPPTEMRCLDPKTLKWGAREPLQKPRSSGEHLRSISYGNVTRCEGIYVVQNTVPESDVAVCYGGPGEEAGELVGVVDGDVMLLGDERGIRVNRGPENDQGLTIKQANALIAGSAGSLVVGNGCCRFLTDGRLARFAKDAAEHVWPVLGAPPEGQYWHQTPLASPSQRWAVAFSKASTAPAVTLWLLRLTNRR
jgi:hypothetical protein